MITSFSVLKKNIIFATAVTNFTFSSIMLQTLQVQQQHTYVITIECCNVSQNSLNNQSLILNVKCY